MSSREEVLAAIGRQRVEASPLPDLEGPWTVYADRVAQFRAAVETVGARFVAVEQIAEIDAALATVPAWSEAVTTISLVPGAGASTLSLADIDDPHDLADVDCAIVPGEFGVAENGAIWLTDRGLSQRVLYFIVQHLAVVLPAEALVNNMHEAYRRLEFSQPGFGMFLSGPSKTADIEQSLVIGAHGARSLSVVLLGSGR